MLFKKHLTGFSSVLVILAAVFIVGCFNDDDGDDPIFIPPGNAVFNSDTSTRIDNSIITLPESLSSQPGSKDVRMTRSGGEMTGIFEGIRQYVGMAEMLKNFLKEVMTNILSSPALKYAPMNEVITIPSDATDTNGPKKIKIERPQGESYAWKISLYFSENSTAPEMIVRFTIEGEGAKGRMLFNITEEDETISAAGISGIDLGRYLDITFDGTTATKTMEIKFIQDLSEITAYAAANWGTLTTAQKSALDLGQPSKVFLNAGYDGTEYTIYGTSYHPGWSTQASLTGDGDGMWGDNGRSMYMFKAKAIEGSVDGAKLYLELSLETDSDASNVWTDDSVGNVFTAMMLASLNAYIAMAHDGNDDPDIDGDVTAEKALADNIVTWITGSPPLEESDYTITQAELEAFVNTPQIDPDAQDFQDTYNSIKHMINPAFFDSTDGFLGTYDVTNDVFYNYSSGNMTAGTKPEDFTTLNALDLSTIDPYIPTEVVAATITVE